jgi:hypothetical protein
MLYDTKSLTNKEEVDFIVEKYNQVSKMIFRFFEVVIADHLTPMYVKENEYSYEA